MYDLVLLRLDGTVTINAAGYVAGPPQCIGEIAASSAPYSRALKLAAYRAAGVGEVLLWDTEHHRLTWYTLESGRYIALTPDAAGVMESHIFPGLRLDVPALVRGDHAAVLAALAR